MNIVFFGTPDFARDFLKELYEDQDINICAVVAQSDKPVGRKQILTPPATKVFALQNNIPVLQPEKLKDQAVLEELKKFNADIFVIVAYGKIIPQNILDIPKLGNINVHPSKLPKYRGPSPLQAVIEAGDSETAISVMLIDDKMDHGPLLAQQTLKLDAQETPETLR
ncbi:methionyl-tRNA formyltransferase, partial [Candidatus Uhrbacteria bacterium CG_4_10_14_0_2_um_filter_41_7]